MPNQLKTIILSGACAALFTAMPTAFAQSIDLSEIPGLSPEDAKMIEKLSKDPRLSGSEDDIRAIANELMQDAQAKNAPDATGDTSFPGDLFESGNQGETAFPGDLFGRNPGGETAFPGDLFDGEPKDIAPTAFPGDLFALAESAVTQSDWLLRRAKKGKRARAVYDLESQYREDLALLGEKASLAARYYKASDVKTAKAFAHASREISKLLMDVTAPDDVKRQKAWLTKAAKTAKTLAELSKQHGG